MMKTVAEAFVEFIKEHPMYQKEGSEWAVVEDNGGYAAIFYNAHFPEMKEALTNFKKNKSMHIWNCVFLFKENTSDIFSCIKNRFDNPQTTKKEFFAFIDDLAQRDDLTPELKEVYHNIRLRHFFEKQKEA